MSNSHSDNKHENNEWRPFWEATFFVPEIPFTPITDGPGTPVYPPGDPGVPVPGGGTGVVIAVPLMDNDAPNTAGLEAQALKLRDAARSIASKGPGCGCGGDPAILPPTQTVDSTASV